MLKDPLLNPRAYISRSSKIGLIEGHNLCSKKAFFCGTQKMTTPFSGEINQKFAKTTNCFLNQPKKDNIKVPTKGVNQPLHVNQL